jgi:hypothetical protein
MSKIVEKIMDKDFAGLKEDIETMVAEKLYDRIQNKKLEILSEINGVPKEKMSEIISQGK